MRSSRMTRTHFNVVALIGILILFIGGCQSTTSTGPEIMNPIMMGGGVPVNVSPDKAEISKTDPTVTITVELPAAAVPTVDTYYITYSVDGDLSSDKWKAALRDLPTQVWANARHLEFKLSIHPEFKASEGYTAVTVVVNAHRWGEDGAPPNKLTSFTVIPIP